MPILTPVEAKSVSGRLLHLAIFLVLLVGGVTMVYPFAVMIAGSLRSEMDESQLDLVPDYLVEDDVLTRKFYETKYNQEIKAFNTAHRGEAFTFLSAAVPDIEDTARVAALKSFIGGAELPMHWQILGGIEGTRTVPEKLRDLRQRVSARFGDNLEAYSRETGEPIDSWLGVVMLSPDWTSRRYELPVAPILETYLQMLEEAEPGEIILISLTDAFLDTMIFTPRGRDLAAFNEASGMNLSSWSEFRLPTRVSEIESPLLRDLWLEYVRELLSPSFIAIADPAEQLPAYRAFLRQEHNSPAALAEAWGQPITSFEQVQLPSRRWLTGGEQQDYLNFLLTLEPDAWRLDDPETAWLDWQADKLPDPTPLPLHAVMPQLEHQYAVDHAASLRWDYATRNFINVWDELVTEGRALINTVLLCIFAICTALLINPLAAYALSRFQLPGSFKFLLVLMATMAFPPMVALIPQFIILRELGLINTFVALVLPLAANGYLIFLLKGFFDSLPSELYEAATIDGAGEIRIFFQITMSLSKPILAVLALSTFTSAYTMFLYALIVAPDPDMWLISVWLFQYQQNSGSGGVYASVLIASIPTLLIFIFVQRTIMRGIVVPTEK